MTVKVNHSTTPDGSFSVAGAAAWEADHTLTGVGTMAEQNANNVNITGGSITGVTGVGTVTGVTGTAPIASSGGTTPAISIPKATTSVDGYLSATDWNTFNTISTGGVVGPASATDNAIARFDTTTGKLIQNSTVTVSDAGVVDGVTHMNNVDYIDFDTTYATTLGAGQLGWDGNNTLGLGMTANVVQEVGLQTYIYGKASSAITKGQLIQKTGAVGASGVITFAPSTAGLTDSQPLIGVAAEDIALNGFGFIVAFGNLRGFDTTGSSVGETWADGDTLYYNPAGSGKFTKNKPTAPNIKAEIAIITHASGGGSGSIAVDIIHGTNLGGTDANVQITNPAQGNLLLYNGTYWYNATSVGGGNF